MTFYRVEIKIIDDLMLKAIKQITDKSIFGHDVKWVIEQAHQNSIQLWRGENSRGVFAVITYAIEHPAGKMLYIWGIGGKGYVRSHEKVWEELVRYCKDNNYKWLSAASERGAFHRLAKRFGKMQVSTHWVKELTDVCS